MYYVFQDFVIGAITIFNNQEDCKRFERDFIAAYLSNGMDIPLKGGDYNITKIKMINPTYVDWCKETDS